MLMLCRAGDATSPAQVIYDTAAGSTDCTSYWSGRLSSPIVYSQSTFNRPGSSQRCSAWNTWPAIVSSTQTTPVPPVRAAAAAAAAAGSVPTVSLRGPTQLCSHHADYSTYSATTDCAPVHADQYAYPGRRLPDALKMEHQLHM